MKKLFRFLDRLLHGTPSIAHCADYHREYWVWEDYRNNVNHHGRVYGFRVCLKCHRRWFSNHPLPVNCPERRAA
jgi:hypothetical protein